VEQGAVMVFQIPQYWDVAIDGIQILLCFFILVILIRYRKKNREFAPDKAIRESGPSFNTQLFTQSLKQKVDQAFANIAATVDVEQRKLDKVLSIGDSEGRGYDMVQYQTGRHRPVNQEILPLSGDESGNDPLHEQIYKLAVKGMSTRQISEELKTPLGEVELVLSLRESLEN
jgi:hypothetical protein